MNSFNFQRFRKVVSYDLRNLWSQYGVVMLVLTCMPVALWLIVMSMQAAAGPDDMILIHPILRWIFIFINAYLVAIIAPSRLYKYCNVPRQGVEFAMLPASHGEKFASMVLMCFIVCPLLSIFGGLVLDSFLYLLPFGSYQESLFEAVPDKITMGLASVVDYYSPFSYITSGKIVWLIVLSGLSTISIFFFTNTIFKKLKILFTILASWVISFVLNLICMPIGLTTLLDSQRMERVGYWFDTLDPYASVKAVYMVAILFHLIFITLLLWWSYRRLKKMRY